MKNLFFLVNFSIVIVFSFSANSKDNNNPIYHCDNAKPKLSTIKYSQCLDNVRAKVDKELKTWVNNQLFILEDVAKTTGRKSAYQMFKRSQNNFITYRENNCKWQFLVALPSSDAATAYKKCYIMTSKDKIIELNRINK